MEENKARKPRNPSLSHFLIDLRHQGVDGPLMAIFLKPPGDQSHITFERDQTPFDFQRARVLTQSLLETATPKD